MSVVTCRNCKKKIEKATAFSVKPKVFFCDTDCYEHYYQSTEEGQLELFLDYVWKQYSPEARNKERYMMIRKQAEHYRKKYDFKYKGMLLTVKWVVEIIEDPWHDEYGLGQVFPDRYYQLKEYYEEQKRMREKIKDNDIEKNKTVITHARRRKGLDLGE